MKSTIYIFILIFVFINCKNDRKSHIIEGATGFNPWVFESFYDMNDSLTKVLKDSFEIILNSNPTDAYLKKDIETYNYLKESDLLDKPCKLFSTDDGIIRVYFNESDYAKVKHSIWNSIDGVEEKLTYFTMNLELKKEGDFERDAIYKCREILDFEYREIEDDSMEIEVDLIMNLRPYSFKEIDILYQKHKLSKLSHLEIDSIFPHVKNYIGDLENGYNPFELYENVDIQHLKTDTSEILNFLKEINLMYNR